MPVSYTHLDVYKRQGVTNALVASYKGEMPIITGQDCDITSVKNIIAGKQSMSIFKDTRQLASKLVEMVTAIVEGKEVPVNCLLYTSRCV